MLQTEIHIPEGKSWSLEEAFRHCEQLTQSHYENFPVGSWLVPKRMRPHVYSIYAFARVADDFADEHYGRAYPEEERLQHLTQWERLLDEAYAGRSCHPIFMALAETARRYDLPQQLFRDLLTAFKMDVTTRRYKTFEDLLFYCRRSANPVGRLILYLFGYRDPHLHELSDHICTALQLANFWQDVAVDLKKDRIYLPLEDMQRFGYSIEALSRKTCNEAFQNLLRYEIERTRELFEQGRPLCFRLGWNLRLEIRTTWFGGMRILERIEENHFNIFTQRPIITTSDKVRSLWRGITQRVRA